VKGNRGGTWVVWWMWDDVAMRPWPCEVRERHLRAEVEAMAWGRRARMLVDVFNTSTQQSIGGCVCKDVWGGGLVCVQPG
jgi:hypothetical protein